MSFLGNRVLRREDPKFLTVGGTYVADLDLPGAAWITYVRSTLAHARIESVDVGEAKASPGVVAVLTAADIDLEPQPPEMGMLEQRMKRPYLAIDRVRYVGEPIVAIVSETRAEGVDAAEKVIVEYEPLPVVVDLEEARKNEVLLFPEIGTNVSFELDFGRDEQLFDGCEVVVEGRTINQRVAPCPLEVRSAAASWDGDKLLYNVSTQAPHGVKDGLSQVLGMPAENVHVVAPDVGGGFGAKTGGYSEEVLVAWIARHVGRPCRWVETRSESMLGLGHGRGQIQDYTIGGTRDGKILAYRLRVTQESGAYPMIGAILPFLTRMMLTGVYDIPVSEFNSVSLVTNTVSTVAYRGAGRPEATAAIERAVEHFAAEIGMDPAEVRRKNMIGADRFPFSTPTGATYDVGDYRSALDKVLEAAGYEQLRAEQAARRTAGDAKQLGIGLSVYVEITNGVPGGEYGAVEVRTDGKVIVRTGTSPHGQGHVTAWSMLVAEKLGVDLEDIEVIHGDTAVVPKGVGTFGSRSLQTGGVAVNQAAGEVVDKAKELAAAVLEADPADIVFDKAATRFHVAGTPALAKSWAELAAASQERGEGPLMAEVDFDPDGASFPFGAHLSVVEVDTDTGKVQILRHVSVDDAGTILNPLLAEGQIHGGIAQGAAQALTEEFLYDAEGNPLTANLADYAFISATELPSFETSFMETPTPMNELGAKGIGESGTIGSTPAVQNAVVDALAHLGVRHIDMPTTPERVWRAIASAAS